LISAQLWIAVFHHGARSQRAMKIGAPIFGSAKSLAKSRRRKFFSIAAKCRRRQRDPNTQFISAQGFFAASASQ
jgi:hypothetical protein